MGKMQRDKGKRFERQIAKKLREKFPEYSEEIRRSIQSRQAEESDVTGLPGLWVECQDAAVPTPKQKLLQAERDVHVANLYRKIIPIAVTHKSRAKEIFVTLRLANLHYLFEWHLRKQKKPIPSEQETTPQVRILLEDFLTIVEEYVEHASQCQNY